jgi:hypothetical protein
MQVSPRYKIYFLLQYFVLGITVNSYSQDYSYIRYDTKDGLAGSVVYDALQDNEGFMWFATENGLSRFDGKDFTTFTTKDGLPDNEILKLFLDSKGRVWIMPFRPSICYYYKGKIYNSTSDSMLSKLALVTYAYDMAEDKQGNLFIAEMKAWHEISKDQVIKTVDSANNYPIAVDALGIDKYGEAELLVTIYTDALSRSLLYLVHPGRENMKVENKSEWPEVQSSIINPDYIIIPNNNHAQLSFYKDKSKTISTTLPLNTVSISYIDKRKVIVNTRKGIKFFDPETKIFSELIFKDFSFTSAFQDKENNLWLTTSGSGVLMVPSFQFRNYSFVEQKENPEITALSIMGDTLYAAGWDKKLWRSPIDTLAFSSQIGVSPEGGKVVAIFPFHNKPTVFNSGYFENPLKPGLKQPISLKSVSVG